MRLSPYPNKIPKPIRIKPVKTRKYKHIRIPTIPGTRSINIIEQIGFGTSNISTTSVSGFATQTRNVSSFQHLGTRTRNGVTNPRWKDQTRQGVNATTAMSAIDITEDRSFFSAYSIGNCYSTATGGLTKFWNDVSSGFLTYPIGAPNQADSATISEVHNRCIAKFIDEVNAAQSSENLTGRSIKHFKHDVHSTLHPMSGIRSKIDSYLTSLEKVPYGKLKGPGLYSTITQAYLEFKFGVEPFVTDISDIVSDMVIRDRKRNPSVPVQANAHKRYIGSNMQRSPSDLGFMGGPYSAYQNELITSTYSERIRGAVRTGVNDDGKLGIIQDNRLLPKDWAPTIFSILPYAWMVNYFTNIRDIIDAASFRYSDLVWACFTRVDLTEFSFGNVGFHVLNRFAADPFEFQIFATDVEGGNAYFTFRTITRTAISPSSLVPTFAFSIPTSTTPWVNMMAAFSPRIFSLVGKLSNLI